MEFNGLVGVQSASDGSKPIIRLGRQGEAIVQPLHGDYYEAALRGRLYSGGNPAGVTTSVGLATTHTGLCLSNPNGSNTNLVLNWVGVGELVAPAAASIIGIATGFNNSTNVTQTTPILPANNLVGGVQGVGLLASSVTLPTAPTLRQVLGAMGTAAATTFGLIMQPNELKGVIILPPGGYACTFTSTTSGASGMAFSFTWEEVPVSG